jgi:hypothetical protein
MEDSYKRIAIQLALKPPGNRTKECHCDVVWANFCDVFTSRREFDWLVEARERRINEQSNKV